MLSATVDATGRSVQQQLPALRADPHLAGPLASMPNAELILGTLSNACKGQGICKILPLGSKVSARCRAVKATLIKMDEHRLHILLYPQSGCRKMRRRLLSKSTFIVEEPFQLPNWVCNMLTFNGKPAIPAGQYLNLSLGGKVAYSFSVAGGSDRISPCSVSV